MPNYWKTIQKKMCPEDKQPPSVWTVMIIVVLLVGVALWLLGVPWQFNLAFLLIPLLLVIGGQQLAKRMRKEGYGSYGSPQGPPQKAMSPWAAFWFIVLFTVFAFAIRLPFGLAERYSWPDWSILAMCGTCLLIGVIGIIVSFYLYRQRKKQSRKQPDEQNTPITKSKV